MPADVRARVLSGRAAPEVGCFFVYPTVSTQPGANADLRIDPQETSVAGNEVGFVQEQAKLHT